MEYIPAIFNINDLCNITGKNHKDVIMEYKDHIDFASEINSNEYDIKDFGLVYDMIDWRRISMHCHSLNEDDLEELKDYLVWDLLNVLDDDDTISEDFIIKHIDRLSGANDGRDGNSLYRIFSENALRLHFDKLWNVKCLSKIHDYSNDFIVDFLDEIDINNLVGRLILSEELLDMNFDKLSDLNISFISERYHFSDKFLHKWISRLDKNRLKSNRFHGHRIYKYEKF